MTDFKPCQPVLVFSTANGWCVQAVVDVRRIEKQHKFFLHEDDLAEWIRKHFTRPDQSVTYAIPKSR